MSIESGGTTTSHKLFGATDHRAGKRAGKADAAADASNNFSMLMGMLAAEEDASGATNSIGSLGDETAGFAVGNALVDPVANGNDSPLAQSKYMLNAMNSEYFPVSASAAQPPLAAGNLIALQSPEESRSAAQARPLVVGPASSLISVGAGSADLEGNGALAQSGKALTAINSKAFRNQQESDATPLARPTVLGQGGLLAAVGIGSADLEGNESLAQFGQALKAIDFKEAPVSLGSGPAMGQDRSGGLPTIKTGPPPMPAAIGGAESNRGARAMSIDAGQGVVAQPEVRVVGHTPPVAQNVSATQVDMKETRTHVSTVDMAARSEVGGTLAQLSGTTDDLERTQERVSAKSSGARFGDASPGNFGAAAGVNTRADAPYEVEATAAAVPDTAIAETVSYWAAQGVQSAELTLDGFGSDPVEVRISLNGDQAQVDFRTDQTDVRQALEAATAELRELLSGEGLQLAGVSVGAFGGRNAQGEAQQPSPGAKSVEVVPEPETSTLRSRSSNTTVGRSLDLFV